MDDVAQWVEQFAYVWQSPQQRLERLMGLLSSDILLKAPTTPPESRGQAACRGSGAQTNEHLHSGPQVVPTGIRSTGLNRLGQILGHSGQFCLVLQAMIACYKKVTPEEALPWSISSNKIRVQTAAGIFPI